MASATETGSNVFPVDYFGRRAYLAQSPQFYKQVMVGALERVYEVGPVFRAEPHDTARHLATYVSLDAELGFVRDHTDVMAVLRDAVAGMVAAVAGRAAAAVEALGLVLPEVPAAIPGVDFTDAQRMVEEATGEAVVGEPDLAPPSGPTAARSCSSPATRRPSGRSTPIPTRRGPGSPTASTCCSAASSW